MGVHALPHPHGQKIYLLTPLSNSSTRSQSTNSLYINRLSTLTSLVSLLIPLTS
jgi:hypothetical protein